jgi:hypothetical protein
VQQTGLLLRRTVENLAPGQEMLSRWPGFSLGRSYNCRMGFHPRFQRKAAETDLPFFAELI